MDSNDIIEIHQLLSLYGHVGDMPPSPEKSELQKQVYTSDAVLDMSELGFGRVEGLDAIREWGKVAEAQERRAGAHLMTNVYVYEENGQTRVRSKFAIPVGEFWSGGDYEDVVVKGPEGWRIRERILRPLWGNWPDPVGLLP